MKGDTTPPTDAEIDAHDGPWWIVLDHAAGFATRCAEGDEAKVWARRQRERGAAYVWRAFHMSTGELVRRCAAAAPKPMGFAEALDAVRRGRVGPATCAACNGEWGMSRDNCAACGYPSVHVDIETWGRVLG